MHRFAVALLVLLMAGSVQAQNGTDETDAPEGDETDQNGTNQTVGPEVDPWLAQRSTQMGISLVAAVILLVAFVQVARN